MLTIDENTWNTFSLFDFAQRPTEWREVLRTHGLDSRVVSAIEWRLSVPAASRFGVSRPVEPDSQVVHLYWVGGWICSRIGEGSARESVWRRSRAWRYHKCLNAETPNEI